MKKQKKGTINETLWKENQSPDQTGILKFPQLPEASPNPILITDAKGCIFYVNPAWEILTGYKFKDVRGKNPQFLQTGKTPKKVYQELWKALVKGKTYSTKDIRDKKKNGEEYQIHSTFYPIRDDGKNLFYVQTQHDITLDKVFEDALKESEKKYRDIMEQASDGIFIADNEGHYLDVNEAGAKMLNFSKNEIIGKSIFDFIPENDAKRLRVIREKLINGETDIGEWQLKCRDGSLKNVEVSAKILPDGRWQGFVRDISERKLAQEAIVMLNAKITKILNSISDGFFTLDASWRFTYINRVAEQLFPSGSKDILGRNIWKLYPRLVGSDLEKRYKNAMETQEKITFKLNSTSGKIYSVHCYPSQYGLSVYFNDITLEEEIAEREKAFISIASHELKTPITSIHLYIQLLQKHLDKTHDEFAKKLLLNFKGQVTRLKDLVNEILDTSSITSGQLKLNHIDLNFTQLTKDIVNNIQQLTKTHKIIFRTKKQLRVSVDKIRISEVLTNLLTNAIKYSPNANKVIVKVFEKEEKVIVSIKDFGIGIPENKKQAIFTRFFRTEKSEQTAAGLGLGLFISYNIIRAHKGEMWLESEEGKGSTFYFSLPLKK